MQSSQPGAKRQSSSQAPLPGTPGVDGAYGTSPGGAAGNTTFLQPPPQAGGAPARQYTSDGYNFDNTNGAGYDGMQMPAVANNDPRMQNGNMMNNQRPPPINGTQQPNGEYMDHEEQQPRRGGLGKLMDILTCRCG